MEKRQRVLVHHLNPWGSGVSLTVVWCPPFDGELTPVVKQSYEKHGWTFTYEDCE